LLSLFFFSSRRRHTRFSRDWSSDVCSSDLIRYSSGGIIFPRFASILQILQDSFIQFTKSMSFFGNIKIKFIKLVQYFPDIDSAFHVVVVTHEYFTDNQCPAVSNTRSEEHTSELQSRENLVCRLLL